MEEPSRGQNATPSKWGSVPSCCLGEVGLYGRRVWVHCSTAAVEEPAQWLVRAGRGPRGADAVRGHRVLQPMCWDRARARVGLYGAGAVRVPARARRVCEGSRGAGAVRVQARALEQV